MAKELEDLKLEAESLGITFNKNIGAEKLQEKIDAYYDAESTASKVNEDIILDETDKAKAVRKAKAVIAAQEKENAKSDIVKITMIDRRESATATEVWLGNGDFGMRVPLDVFVEMPKILIAQAEDAKAIVHTEVDGLSVPKLVKKYVVEYKNR